MSASSAIFGEPIPNTRLLLIAHRACRARGTAALFARARATDSSFVRASKTEQWSARSALMSSERSRSCLPSAGWPRDLQAFFRERTSDISIPTRGTSMLIFAFIVVVIGGLGSVTGSAIAAAVVAIVQQFLNFYAAPGIGDFSVVILLAAALLLRPRSGETT